MAEGEVGFPEALEGIWEPARVLYLSRATEVDALCELLNALQRGVKVSPPETEEDEVVDLDMCYEVLNTVRQDLVDQALGGNIARKHHLETAVAVFADIGVLLRAEEIIRELFDPREETDDAVPQDDHGQGEDGEEPNGDS